MNFRWGSIADLAIEAMDAVDTVTRFSLIEICSEFVSISEFLRSEHSSPGLLLSFFWHRGCLPV